MYLKYGSFQHVSGEASVKVAKQAIFTDRGTPRGVKERWSIDGRVYGTSQSDLTTKIAAIQSAYSTNNLALGFYQDDNSLTHLYLDPSAALGGIRVMDLNFPEGGGKGEYANVRHYSIVVEADFPDANDGLVMYQETLSFQGTGGPRHVWIETLDGPPVKQTVCDQTLCYATQQGHAVGKYSRPFPAPPLWPFYEDEPQRNISDSGGQMHGGFFEDFGIQWSYRFTSDTPLFGSPHLA